MFNTSSSRLDPLGLSETLQLRPQVKPFRSQLLKWVGNKQRFAHEIISWFPAQFGTYYEPFLGSGAVLGTLAPSKAVASDSFAPLIEIWSALRYDPEKLFHWYEERWQLAQKIGKGAAYLQILQSYNANPNGADFVYLARACYGGVVRFRKDDGYMSTPVGVHAPINPKSFRMRVLEWARRVSGTTFHRSEYSVVVEGARADDLVYCDPPYSDTQAILYGAQSFSLKELFAEIQRLKERGVFVALSIDGTKKSGSRVCNVRIPDGLFEREIFVNVGRSMLRRFQMQGKSLEDEVVADRLLLTY